MAASEDKHDVILRSFRTSGYGADTADVAFLLGITRTEHEHDVHAMTAFLASFVRRFQVGDSISGGFVPLYNQYNQRIFSLFIYVFIKLELNQQTF